MTDDWSNEKPCVVISQPMYFPWVGMLEQIRLCDTFVYYDDVQYARGFFNRVQIKSEKGTRWLTVPLLSWRRGELIKDVRIDNSQNWKRSHRDQLKHAYAAAPFLAEMLDLVDEVFERKYEVIGDLAKSSMDALVRYFSVIGESKSFLVSSDMNIPGSSTQRLINICRELNAKTYLTGHGARNYLDHEAFESEDIKVAYIDYETDKYPQLHGDFTPYVSALDLIAHCGPDGVKYIRGKMQYWKNFLGRTSYTLSKK